MSPRSLDQLSAQLLDPGGKRGELSRHSVHTYMRAINRLLTWAKDEGEEVAAQAQLPRLPAALIDVLSRDEIQSMEDAARTERDKLLIRILADTGIRVGELVGLRTTDVVQRDRNHFLRVRGKAARSAWSRFLSCTAACSGTQSAAGQLMRPAIVSSSRTVEVAPGTTIPLTTSGVVQLLRNVAHEAHIENGVYPHLFRHSYATWALNRGMNPITLAQIRALILGDDPERL